MPPQPPTHPPARGSRAGRLRRGGRCGFSYFTRTGSDYTRPRSLTLSRRKGEVDFPSTFLSLGSIRSVPDLRAACSNNSSRLCNQQMLPLGSPERTNCADARLGVPASVVLPTQTHGAIQSRTDSALTRAVWWRGQDFQLQKSVKKSRRL